MTPLLLAVVVVVPRIRRLTTQEVLEATTIRRRRRPIPIVTMTAMTMMIFSRRNLPWKPQLWSRTSK